MRVGYLANIYPRASDTYVREEVAALRRRGHDVRTFAMRSPDPAEVAASGTHAEHLATTYLVPGFRAEAADVARWALRHPARLLLGAGLAARLRSPGAKGLLWPWVYLLEALRLALHAERAGVRHVHAHTSEGPAAVAMLAAALGGGTWSMTVHGPYEWDRAPVLHLDLKVARASHVVAISEYTRGQLYRWVPPELWARVHVVRCGAGRRRRAPPARRRPVGRASGAAARRRDGVVSACLRAAGVSSPCRAPGSSTRPRATPARAGSCGRR